MSSKFNKSTIFGILNNFKLMKVKNCPHKILTNNFSLSHVLAGRVSFNLSDIGEGIRDVVIKEWFVKVGDKVSQFDNICEVQSDKASVTITSRYEGTISKLHYKIDDIALVGKPLIDVETEDVVNEDHTENEITTQVQIENHETPDQNLTATNLCIPSVRRLAKENKIDLSKIKGTGKNGRILKEDVIEFLNKSSPQSPIESQTSPLPPVDRTEKVKGFQKAMVKSMTEALKIPHFVYSDEIKTTQLSELRKYLKTIPELNNVKISFMPFFIKAVSNALQRYPIINAILDENCENITFKSQHNIGVAMDTKVGLAVPVIKNVGNMSIIQIAEELNRLIKSGKEGTFSPNDLAGGTFTISNIGSVGGTYTKPIIMPPQLAIIALGASQLLPRFDESRNVIAEEIVSLSASADHRIIDGATMAKFIRIVKRQIEKPNLLFLNI